jgi:membrane-bound serine protease (ClpP class)
MIRRAVFVALLGTAALTGLAARATDAAPDDGPRVLVTEVHTAITPVIAEHLDDVIDRGARGDYEAVVIELDTPGGLVSSMRSIISDILAAELPVVVYVSPSGARAGSAGALITLAAHVAAMAPGTTIGAATPVDIQGGEVGDKIVEDAAAYAEALAELRGRNVRFAIAAVREGRAIVASRALEIGAVDVVARDLPSLLEQIDGREVTLDGDRTVTLRTSDAAVDRYDMSLFRRVLQFLADPNIAFLLLSVGTLALIYELASPGGGVAGVLGALMIVLGMFSLAVLPVHALGFIFLIIAVGCFIAELYAPGIGVFAFLGAGAMVLAALFLFREQAPGVSVSLSVVLPTIAVVAGAVVLAGRLAWRTRIRPAVSGSEQFAGREIVVAHADGSSGEARFEGSWWKVRRVDGPLEEGQTVRIQRVDGLDLVVEPIEERNRP